MTQLYINIPSPDRAAAEAAALERAEMMALNLPQLSK
jgi:hypothetical protein